MLVQDTQLGGVETDGGQAAPAANAAKDREPEGCAGHSHHIWKTEGSGREKLEDTIPALYLYNSPPPLFSFAASRPNQQPIIRIKQ